MCIEGDRSKFLSFPLEYGEKAEKKERKGEKKNRNVKGSSLMAGALSNVILWDVSLPMMAGRIRYSLRSLLTQTIL